MKPKISSGSGPGQLILNQIMWTDMKTRHDLTTRFLTHRHLDVDDLCCSAGIRHLHARMPLRCLQPRLMQACLADFLWRTPGHGLASLVVGLPVQPRSSTVFTRNLVTFAPQWLCFTLYVVLGAPILVVLTLCLGGEFCLFLFLLFFLGVSFI